MQKKTIIISVGVIIILAIIIILPIPIIHGLFNRMISVECNSYNGFSGYSNTCNCKGFVIDTSSDYFEVIFGLTDKSDESGCVGFASDFKCFKRNLSASGKKSEISCK